MLHAGGYQGAYAIIACRADLVGDKELIGFNPVLPGLIKTNLENFQIGHWDGSCSDAEAAHRGSFEA